jgi:hypothetical protein
MTVRVAAIAASYWICSNLLAARSDPAAGAGVAGDPPGRSPVENGNFLPAEIAHGAVDRGPSAATRRGQLLQLLGDCRLSEGWL